MVIGPKLVRRTVPGFQSIRKLVFLEEKSFSTGNGGQDLSTQPTLNADLSLTKGIDSLDSGY